MLIGAAGKNRVLTLGSRSPLDLSEKARIIRDYFSCNACKYDISEAICLSLLICNTCHLGKTTLLSSAGGDEMKTAKTKNKGKVHDKGQSKSSINTTN